MFSSVGVLFICSCYYCSFPLTLLLRRRPHVSRLDFRRSLPSEHGLIPEQRLVIELKRAMASDRGQNRYSLFMAPQTLLRFENCSSSYCLLSSWRRFDVFESSCPSFHRTVFFGAPLAFLRVVKFFFRCILFLEASQWACFVVASFSSPYFFGSSFRQLSYIQDSNKSTFPAFVARGSHRPKEKGEKGDGNRCPC